MFKNILIATDGSELGTKALRSALSLAKALGAKATAITVTEPWVVVAPGEMAMAFPIEEYEKAMNENAKRILGAASAIAAEIGVPCATRQVNDTFTADGIIEAAHEEGADLIAMASHGRRGLSRFFLGSQANRVVTQSTIPVLICR
jgi:nucleotide-binding universal stress UspA family protein